MKRLAIDELPLVAVVLLIDGLVLVVAGHVMQYGGFHPAAFLEDYSSDIALEMIGIAVTVLFIDRLNQRRDERLEATVCAINYSATWAAVCMAWRPVLPRCCAVMGR